MDQRQVSHLESPLQIPPRLQPCESVHMNSNPRRWFPDSHPPVSAQVSVWTKSSLFQIP